MNQFHPKFFIVLLIEISKQQWIQQTLDVVECLAFEFYLLALILLVLALKMIYIAQQYLSINNAKNLSLSKLINASYYAYFTSIGFNKICSIFVSLTYSFNFRVVNLILSSTASVN